VELGNIATPQEETTPELRYASLHRAVERGMASQDVFRELAEICLQLGHQDEAVRVHEGMEPGPLRDHVASRLRRHGLLAHAPSAADAPRSATARGHEATASAAREHALDAVQYMAQGIMPAAALSTMLAFPILVTAGGMLTGGSPWLFAALAAPPSLCVLGLVGAIARKVYLRSADGESDPPEWPSAADTLQEGKRFLLDHLAVYGAYVAPAVIALLLGVPAMSMLPALLLGMFLAPMALMLRQHRGDVSALSPVTIVRGISSSRGYMRIAGLYWLAFLPAVIAFFASLGNAPWIQLAIVGPLSVLPAFGTARVLGTFVDAHRERLGVLLDLAATPRAAAQAPQHKPMRGARPVGVSPTAQAKPQAAQPRAVRPTTAAQPAPKPSVPAARIEGRAPKPTQARPQAAKPTAGKPTAAKVGTQPAARTTQSKQPAATGFAGPDLSGIPGATVISGADRERMGAAAKKG
jgi:hypothetical protein